MTCVCPPLHGAAPAWLVDDVQTLCFVLLDTASVCLMQTVIQVLEDSTSLITKLVIWCDNVTVNCDYVSGCEIYLFFLWRCGPTRAMASSFLRFLDHAQRRTTVGRTPLDEWPARRGDLYLTTHNTHNRETSMSLVGFEPTISAGERPQTYALDRAATGTDKLWI